MKCHRVKQYCIAKSSASHSSSETLLKCIRRMDSQRASCCPEDPLQSHLQHQGTLEVWKQTVLSAGTGTESDLRAPQPSEFSKVPLQKPQAFTYLNS